MNYSSDDILAMHDLIYRYCHEHDARNAAAVADCYAENGGAHLAHHGREAVREFYERIYAANNERRRHVLTNPIVDGVDEDHARVRAYEQLYLITETGEISLALTGVYVVDIVREDDGWKILRLDPHLDVPYDIADNPHIASERQADGTYRLVEK